MRFELDKSSTIQNARKAISDLKYIESSWIVHTYLQFCILSNTQSEEKVLSKCVGQVISNTRTLREVRIHYPAAIILLEAANLYPGEDEKSISSNLSTSEICMLEAVNKTDRLLVPYAEQEVRAVGRRSRQPVITRTLDLSLLDDTYAGITKQKLWTNSTSKQPCMGFKGLVLIYVACYRISIRELQLGVAISDDSALNHETDSVEMESLMNKKKPCVPLSHQIKTSLESFQTIHGLVSK
ncbi:hypothetical protein AVEN_125584-1 [Araneus ventricosus]|uniref:Uncharacterized protein n=1 Tax=Araneus ventricosus TaxID=182803 RepID=A0A4Y2U7R0_ARAVE|nr:hypothetical protein AVEN_125584-1 [Araneus ventricosus]